MTKTKTSRNQPRHNPQGVSLSSLPPGLRELTQLEVPIGAVVAQLSDRGQVEYNAAVERARTLMLAQQVLALEALLAEQQSDGDVAAEEGLEDDADKDGPIAAVLEHGDGDPVDPDAVVTHMSPSEAPDFPDARSGVA